MNIPIKVDISEDLDGDIFLPQEFAIPNVEHRRATDWEATDPPDLSSLELEVRKKRTDS